MTASELVEFQILEVYNFLVTMVPQQRSMKASQVMSTGPVSYVPLKVGLSSWQTYEDHNTIMIMSRLCYDGYKVWSFPKFFVLRILWLCYDWYHARDTNALQSTIMTIIVTNGLWWPSADLMTTCSHKTWLDVFHITTSNSIGEFVHFVKFNLFFWKLKWSAVSVTVILGPRFRMSTESCATLCRKLQVAEAWEETQSPLL